MFSEFVLPLIQVSRGKMNVKEECVKLSINSDVLLDEIPEFICHMEGGDQMNSKDLDSVE